MGRSRARALELQIGTFGKADKLNIYRPGMRKCLATASRNCSWSSVHNRASYAASVYCCSDLKARLHEPQFQLASVS